MIYKTFLDRSVVTYAESARKLGTQDCPSLSFIHEVHSMFGVEFKSRPNVNALSDLGLGARVWPSSIRPGHTRAPLLLLFRTPTHGSALILLSLFFHNERFKSLLSFWSRAHVAINLRDTMPSHAEFELLRKARTLQLPLAFPPG
jgi:hypothetical protein